MVSQEQTGNTHNQPCVPTPARRQRPRSLLTSLLLGACLFLGLLFVFEGLFRWTDLDRIFGWRSLGTYHGQFEIKWFELRDYVRSHGGVDVLLLGNSMVNTGIDPDVLATEYEVLTGERLRVFNFGVEGLTVAPNSHLARVLAARYHPGSILFFTEMRDYAAGNGVEVERRLLADEWMKARLGGKETVRTWLKENSRVVQHLLFFRNWSRSDFLDSSLMLARRFADTTTSGYERDANVGKSIEIPPDPADPDEQENFKLFTNFSIDPGRLENLKSILDLHEDGTLVVITEMPVHANYFTYFGNEQAHENYLKKLVPFVEKNGGIFLPPPAWQRFPLYSRVDHHHLNAIGAVLHSRMLAQNLAVLCLDQSTCLLPAADGMASP